MPDPRITGWIERNISSISFYFRKTGTIFFPPPSGKIPLPSS
jgi:hypothetical protein